MELGTRKAFVVVVLVGVVGTGSAVHFLNLAGFGTLGSVVWFLGYSTMVLVLWYGWIRPLDLTGGTDPSEVAEATSEGEGDTETDS